MAVYGKIFEAIYASTIIAEGHLVRLVFMDMVILANEDGIVDYTPPTLAMRTGTPLEVVEHAISRLGFPDPYSDSPDYEGRRIVPVTEVEWHAGNRGWLVVNVEKYREKGTREDRRKKDAERQRRHRAKNTENVTTPAMSRENRDETANVTQDPVTLPPDVTQIAPNQNQNQNQNQVKDKSIVVSNKAASRPSHEEVIDCYHELLPDLPRVRAWSKARNAALNARMKDKYEVEGEMIQFTTIARWKKFFTYVGKCPHLNGENNRDWTANLPWLLKTENFAKVIEGQYERRSA